MEVALQMQYQEFFDALAAHRAQIEILENEPMSLHTTFRIGGVADVFLKPKTTQALRAVLQAVRQSAINYVVVGNGSNLLVRDEGYRGVVICTSALRQVHREGHCIIAEAGALLSQVARVALEASLEGFAFAAGIPGTLGGAVFMNAGAYGGEMKDVLQQVTYLDEQGQEQQASVDTLALGYRTSMFKEKEEYTIVRAVLALQLGDAACIRQEMNELAESRRSKQPITWPSAGSTFKRPEGHFAGQLIEQAGLRGFCVGDAQVSEKHCGFVINRGSATCQQVLAVMEEVQARVKQQFGVQLQPEIRVI